MRDRWRSWGGALALVCVFFGALAFVSDARASFSSRSFYHYTPSGFKGGVSGHFSTAVSTFDYMAQNYTKEVAEDGQVWQFMGTGFGFNAFPSGCSFATTCTSAEGRLERTVGPSAGTWVTEGVSIHHDECPNDSTQDGSTCTCNTGFDQSGAAGSEICVASGPTCTPGETTRQSLFMGYQLSPGAPSSGGGSWTGVINGTVKIDVDGCQYAIASSDLYNPECYYYPDAPTKKYCEMTFVATGETAVPTVDLVPDIPNADDPCPAGYGYGTINGIGSCVADGSDPAVLPGEAPPAPAGTETTSGKVDNGDGTSTVTTTTSNSYSTSTSTTVVNNTTGEVVSSSTVTTSTGADKAGAGATDQAQYCRDNPQSPLCRDSSWAGGCGDYSCTGDAVTCAIARQQHEYACQFDESAEAQAFRDTAEGALVLPSAALAAQAANVDGAHDVDVETIWGQNQNRITEYGESCPSPITIPMPWVGTVQVEFDLFCGLADLLKPLVLIAATMLAFGILFRSKEA